MKEIDEYDIAESVRDLISRSLLLSTGDEKVMTLEEAVRIADRGSDLRLQYEAREELIEAAFWSGEAEKALVAYSWCLAQFDKHPESFDEWMLLWRYKWMVNVIFHFPQIPKEQIHLMLDEMERRYRAAGYGLRVVNYYRYRAEKFFGNRDQAIKHFLYAQTLPRDTLSDCDACEIDERAIFQIYCGQDALALRIAEPILEGIKRCRTVPQRTIARVLLPLARLGRWEEAWDYHLHGYHLISNDLTFLEHLSDHLIFLALYGKFERAFSFLETHFHWVKKNTDKYDRYLFFRSVWLLLDVLSDSGEETIKLRLPESFELYDESGVYEISRLKEWFLARAQEIAKLFDARNGTERFATELEETPALKAFKRR